MNSRTADSGSVNDLPGIAAAGNSNKGWRFDRPQWDTQKCIQCGVCALSCPDGAIVRNDQGYYEADEQFCKGCGLCRQQCWTGCISMETVRQKPPWLELLKKIIG